MSNTHWGDVYLYADRNCFVQAMRERSAMKYSHNNRWSLHMAQMALQLDNYKHNFTKKEHPNYGLKCTGHVFRAKERIQFYVGAEYSDALVYFAEVNDVTNWAVY